MKAIYYVRRLGTLPDGIIKPREIIVNTFSVSVFVSFCLFPCRKVHSIRAYLDNFQMTLSLDYLLWSKTLHKLQDYKYF